MKIAVLTGGGDCPGLNAAIRAVVRRSTAAGHRVFGIMDGWSGLVKGRIRPLTVGMTTGILPLGGTILGSSRINPLKISDGVGRCLKVFRSNRFDALVVIGGEGTLNIASVLSRRGLPVVCVPKTIDNDTWGTDYTVGFDTAVQIATDAIDRLHTTAESHHRVMIVEVMGRHAGWIATYAGIAGGADAVLTPEEVWDIRDLCTIIKRRAKRGRHFSIFAVSEDARIRLDSGKILRTPLNHDEYGDIKLGGIGELLAREIEKRTDSEVRVTVLGHVQRGGSPSSFDRVLATRLGVYAANLVHEGRFGLMAVLRGNKIRPLPIRKSAGKVKKIDRAIAEVAKVFFG